MNKAETVKKLINSFELSLMDSHLFLSDNQERFDLKIENDYSTETDLYIFDDESILYIDCHDVSLTANDEIN